MEQLFVLWVNLRPMICRIFSTLVLWVSPYMCLVSSSFQLITNQSKFIIHFFKLFVPFRRVTAFTTHILGKQSKIRFIK